MANGYMTVNANYITPDGVTVTRDFHYELGCFATLVNCENRYKLRIVKQDLVGPDPNRPAFIDFDRPRLIVAAVTELTGHRFRIAAVFDYRPDKDVRDGAPYGFHFVEGAVALLNPPPGMDSPRDLKFIHDLRGVLRHGEAYFIERLQFSIRASAVVDQVAASMRERGGSR